jgi:uncharacterized membrane protein YccC
MVLLQFLAELLVVRNYAAAVVFITPLALVQAALASGQLDGPVAGLIAGRLLETVVGCIVAVAVQAAIPPPGQRPVRALSLRLVRALRPARRRILLALT